MANDKALSLYDRLLVRFGTEGRLSAVHQAELEAIRLEGDISKDDSFWLWFLPIFMTQARLDFLKEADGGARPQLDMARLAESIAARIEPDQIRAEVDSAVVARAVAKAAAPDIQSVIEEAIASVQRPAATVDQSAVRTAVAEASRDSLLHRNLIIAVLAGLMMSLLAGWYSGWQSDKRWEPVVQQLQQQILLLQADRKAK